MTVALVAIAGLGAATCAGTMAEQPAPKENSDVAHAATPPALSPPLEAELAAIRRDPLAAVGFGEKAYLPYELVKGRELVDSPEPGVVPRLSTEALDAHNDRVFRLVMLQILGLRREAAVDTTLVSALADPAVRPLAAYLLGRPGFKGYPARDRKSVAPLLRALATHLDDAGHYDDPWYQRAYATGDLVLAAFVRLAGVDRFVFANPEDRDFLGYTLHFPDAERAGLRAQAKQMPIPAE
ncbi:MAG TPA: hypothetical protein VF516_08795 [Kofleriaceae bacterium]